jgi:hypothetical protein
MAVAQKLLYHLMKESIPLRRLCPGIPEGLAAVVEKMMAKDREQRYQDAASIVAALTSWTEAQRNEAQQQRDEAQKQRDEVRALNEKLQATQAQLRSTLYAALERKEQSGR